MFNYTDSCRYQTIDTHFRSVRKEYMVFCHLTIVIGIYWINNDLRFETFSTFNTNNIVSAIISVLFLLHPISSEATKSNWNMDDCAALIQLDGVSNSYFTVTSPPIADTYICLSGQFKCTRKQKCIPLNLRCNGQDDCGDGEDETDCRKLRHDTFCSLH